ncbi:hypothetical protein [Methylomagnum sp.]
MAKRDELRPEYKLEDLGIGVRGKHYEEYAASLQPEKFDYTDWRQDLFEGMSGREISQKAMEYQQVLKGK